MKTCSKCGVEKPEDSFHFRSRALNTRVGFCKRCAHAKSAEYAKRNPSKVRNIWNKWYKNNRELDNLRHQVSDFNMSVDTYYAMLDKQDGRCAICFGIMRPICIDHCHSTGVVRGLLCRACNAGLGQLRDSAQLLKNALKYLAPFPDETIQSEKQQNKNKKQ